MVISFLTKFLALNKYEVPPSCDYGNYLTQVDILHGYDVKNWGLRYNPLFFILLDIFLRFFDTFTALKVVASLVFSIAAIPFFLLAKKISGNYIAALICTWFFIFYEWYFEMMAWGGNPNFLGISFMLLTLFFLVELFKEPSRKNILLAGFSLSLVIGTHFLVAFFMVLALLIFFALELIFRRKNNVGIVKNLIYLVSAAAIFSLPYVSVYVTFFEYSSGELLRLNFIIQLTTAFFAGAWTFVSQNLAITITVVLGIFALVKFVKEEQNTSLLLGSLFLTPLILASITEQPGRWFYFLPIPIFLCFCLYLKNLFLAIRNARKEVLLLALCFVFIIGVEMNIASANRLKAAVDWYESIRSDEIQALRWISTNTAFNATFVTSGPNRIEAEDPSPGHMYSWWIEGFAKRKSFHTGLTTWYTYKDERADAVLPDKIFAGAYTFEYGGMVVSESFPARIGNPEIEILENGQHQDLLFLRDDGQELVLSPIDNKSVTLHETPFDAENKTLDLNYNATWAEVACNYESSYLKLTRSTIMDLEQPFVDVIFTILPVNSTLKQFDMNLWAADNVSLEGYEINNSTITLYQKALFRWPVTTQIRIIDTDGELLNSTVQGVQQSMPVATYSLKPLNSSLYVHIRISVATASEANDQTFHFYDSYSLIKDLGIDYIFQNKDRIIEYQRFLADSEHFTIVFENETIVIFEVI
jgi:hypothetical protein